MLRDFQGLEIRLTDERLNHILEHPEMVGMEANIEETLLQPERVIELIDDPSVHLYYRFYFQTVVGAKYLCAVVKMTRSPFLLTAYLTNRIKKGARRWPTQGA